MGVDIEKLGALAKAATPGPWVTADSDCCIDIFTEDEYIGNVAEPEDAAYIAAACNAVPELIKMYREVDDEAADANSAWQKVRRENLALREQVQELEKALIELVKIEVSLPECAVCWERDRCTDRSHGDNCLAVGYIVDMAKEAAKEAGK